MNLYWTNPLFWGIVSLVLAPKQKRAGKMRLFWLMMILGCFLVVVGAAALLFQLLTLLALTR